MPSDSAERVIYSLEKIIGKPPTFSDLIKAKDIWEVIQGFWSKLSDETLKESFYEQTIRLLDFDIIYPAFWQEELHSSVQVGLTNVSFPMTAHFIFQNTRKPFTIPPGARVELERSLDTLRKHYNLAETDLLKSWDEVKPLVEGRNISAASTRSLIAKLRNDNRTFLANVEQLIEYGAKLERLEKILKHSYYVPWEDLVSLSEIEQHSDEIGEVWRKFNSVRHLAVNNFFDAINVVSYYTLFEQFEHQTSGLQIKYLPILASGTKMVRYYKDYPARIEHLRAYSTNHDIRPVSPHYLSFATAIEMRTEYNRDILNTIVEEGIQKVNELLREFRLFSDSSREYIGNQMSKSIKDIYLSDFTSLPSFREFCQVYSDWHTHIMESMGNTFLNVTRSDKILRHNFNSAIKRVVQQLQKQYVLSTSEEKMYSQEVEDFGWDSAITTVDSYLDLFSKTEPDENTNLLFYLRSGKHHIPIIQEGVTLIQPDGELKREYQVTNEDIVNIEVYLPHVKSNLFFWERTFGEDDQLCYWKHDQDLSSMLFHSLNFLKSLGFNAQTNIKLIVFAEDLRHEEVINLSSLKKSELLDRVLKITPNPVYIRIEANDNVVLFDILPLFDEINPEVAVMYEGNIHSKVAFFFYETAINTLDKRVISLLLKEFSSKANNSEWVKEKIKNSNIGGNYKVGTA